MDTERRIHQLEVQEAFARGRLAVAEDLGPVAAVLVAVVLHQAY